MGDSAPGTADAVCEALQRLHQAAPRRLHRLLKLVQLGVEVFYELGDPRNDVLRLHLVKEWERSVLEANYFLCKSLPLKQRDEVRRESVQEKYKLP